MPLLTGKVSDVTGTYIDPSEIVEVVVKAPSPRASGGSSAAVIVTRTVPVTVGSEGSLSFNMDQGVAVLIVKTFRSQDTYKMVVTEDMTTIREAIIQASGKLPELEQSQLIELAEQVRQDADFVAGERVLVEAARDAAEGYKTQAGTYLAGVQANADAAEGSAADSEQSATDSESSAQASAGSAAAAAGSASTAGTHRSAAEAARTGAETARTGAETARSGAESAQAAAEAARDEFGLTVSGTTTGAEGSNASVTVSGNGPEYALSFTVPKGDKGEQGIQGIQGIQGPKGDKGDQGIQGVKGDQGVPGEVSQAQLDAAVATLVDGSPEALDTLAELAAALGNDPNFATTVSTEIGLRAKTSDVNTALEGKADSGAENTATWSGVSGKPTSFPSSWSQVSDKPANFPPSTHTHTISDTTGLQSAINSAGTTAAWGSVSGKPSTFAPSAHSHPVSEVTGLQTALDGKAAASHTHTIANVTGLQTALDAKASTAAVNTRPALFSGAGAPPSTIPGAVVGDWWLNTSTMQLFKITGV